MRLNLRQKENDVNISDRVYAKGAVEELLKNAPKFMKTENKEIGSERY